MNKENTYLQVIFILEDMDDKILPSFRTQISHTLSFSLPRQHWRRIWGRGCLTSKQSQLANQGQSQKVLRRHGTS